MKKRQFVAELQESDAVNDYFVAIRNDLRSQQNGKKFLGMVFKDRTGEVGGILWSNAVAISRQFEVGDVVNVQGTVTSYQERLQIRVDQVLPLRDGEYDMADLVFVPENAATLEASFRDLLESIENGWLKKLTQSFLDDEAFMKEFTTAAAGKKWHHAYRGGLLQHCYEIGKLALTVCDLFPEVDRDLLLTGVFLHDIGKIDEMSHEMFVDYTTAGKLLSHLTIGADLVQRRMEKIEGFPETLRLQVLHCILSHHGELVNGSPVVPKTLEALLLYHLDNLDAQANAFVRIVKETRDRAQSWSDYIGLIDRQVWTKDES